MLKGKYKINDIKLILMLSKEELMDLLDILDGLYWLSETIGYNKDKSEVWRHEFLMDLQEAQKFSLIVTPKRMLINNSKCFEQYGQRIKGLLNKGRLYSSLLSNDEKTRRLIRYIQENIDSLQLMRDNIKILDSLMSWHSEIEFREGELEYSTVLHTTYLNSNVVKSGFVADGTKIYDTNGTMGEYPVTVKNANIIIKVKEEFNRLTCMYPSIEVVANGLLFDGKKLGTKKEITYKALHPDIPEEYHRNIINRVDQLEEDIQIVNNYKEALENVKKYLHDGSKYLEAADKLAEEAQKQFDESMQQANDETPFSKEEYEKELKRRLEKETNVDSCSWACH